MGIFSCPCCVSGRCVPEGSGGLLKLSQPGSYWKPGSCWQAGKYWKAVSEAVRCWGLCFSENNGGIWGVVLL